MADLNLNFRQSLNPKVVQRTVLLGRVKMAQAIHMPEAEWAKALSEIEKDPLFQELFLERPGQQKIVSYQRHARANLSGQFYEEQDLNVIGGSGESPETLLGRKKHLLKMIEKIGQKNFEQYFLYREKGESSDAIASACGLTLSEARELQDFIMEMSVQSEFYHPSHMDNKTLIKPTLVGRIVRNDDGTFSMSFFSPHLARGKYEINQDALKAWQKEKKLDRAHSSRIRKYIGILELCNLKQGAFLSAIEYLLTAQKEYLETKDISKMAPISLRQLARILKFAPSTISRVLGTKSVMLPWDHEVFLLHLLPGRRRVVLDILGKIIAKQTGSFTDEKLAAQLVREYGIKISRRTVTACRHALGVDQKRKESPDSAS